MLHQEPGGRHDPQIVNVLIPKIFFALHKYCMPACSEKELATTHNFQSRRDIYQHMYI
jgi:hypothetical protein